MRVPVTFEAVQRLIGELRRHRVAGLASDVAFWAVFSMFPALLIAAGLLSTLDTLVGTGLAIRVEAEVLGALRQVLTSNAQPLVDSVRALFHEQSVGLLTAGTVAAVWSVSSSVSSMIQALDIVYGVRDTRSWLRERLVALALGLGTIVVFSVVMVLLVAGPLFGAGDVIAARLGLDHVFAAAWNWARAPVAVLALTVWIASLFHLGPSRRERWRVELPGALVSALSTVLTSLGLRLYLDFSAARNPVVGVLGGGLLLMLWFYLLAFVLLLGAQVNALARVPARPMPGQPRLVRNEARVLSG